MGKNKKQDIRFVIPDDSSPHMSEPLLTVCGDLICFPKKKDMVTRIGILRTKKFDKNRLVLGTRSAETRANVYNGWYQQKQETKSNELWKQDASGRTAPPWLPLRKEARAPRP